MQKETGVDEDEGEDGGGIIEPDLNGAAVDGGGFGGGGYGAAPGWEGNGMSPLRR